MANSYANRNRINQLMNIAVEMVTVLSVISQLPLLLPKTQSQEDLLYRIAMWEKVWE